MKKNKHILEVFIDKEGDKIYKINYDFDNLDELMILAKSYRPLYVLISEMENKSGIQDKDGKNTWAGQDIQDYYHKYFYKNNPLNFPASKGMTYIGRWFKYIGDEDGDDYGKLVCVIGGELSRDKKSVLLFRCKTKDGQDVDAFPMELVEIKSNPAKINKYEIKIYKNSVLIGGEIIPKQKDEFYTYNEYLKILHKNVDKFRQDLKNKYVVQSYINGKPAGHVLVDKGNEYHYDNKNEHIPLLYRHNPARQSIDQAKKSYKEFTWRNPDDIFKGQLPIYKGEQLIYIGQVTKLWYKSDKFDRVQRIHCHDFKRPHMVFTNKARTFLYIYPCVINSRGIID